MNEADFNALADAELDRLEGLLDACTAEIDYEVKPGGIIEVEFESGTKIIVNRHSAAREIWLAAKSGGFHFRPEAGRWVGTRDGADFYAVLSRCMSEQAGESVTLAG
ncbi:iron donor protein CyaY [Zoogloea dura]|jgi:CyaY protein|uniref:Iron-sulfur cluster assembly protein CyaY n=1 Tax=Zoogloea dura TaxID=2728840 RepID=A0A848G688_9RHOO|nr:iron donor protein CyaY [Zoogloea dura]NML26436.1 iron donor protein CyaY [Zoogloea dura]